MWQVFTERITYAHINPFQSEPMHPPTGLTPLSISSTNLCLYAVKKTFLQSEMLLAAFINTILPVAAPEIFCRGGHWGGIMHFWGDKNQKNCRKWLMFAFFSFNGVRGAEPPTGGKCPPWCCHCLLPFPDEGRREYKWKINLIWVFPMTEPMDICDALCQNLQLFMTSPRCHTSGKGCLKLWNTSTANDFIIGVIPFEDK